MLGIFVLLVVLTLFNIWLERRVVGRMQHRIGPNRVRASGALQSLADGIKLALKEDIVPKAADKVIFWIAPIISTVAAFLAFAVIPLGGQVTMFGQETQLQLTDSPVAVLFVLAIASIGVYGHRPRRLVQRLDVPAARGLRARTAQVISYEVAMGLSFVAVFLYAGSMSTSEIVDAQAGGRRRRPRVHREPAVLVRDPPAAELPHLRGDLHGRRRRGHRPAQLHQRGSAPETAPQMLALAFLPSNIRRPLVAGL